MFQAWCRHADNPCVGAGKLCVPLAAGIRVRSLNADEKHMALAACQWIAVTAYHAPPVRPARDYYSNSGSIGKYGNIETRCRYGMGFPSVVDVPAVRPVRTMRVHFPLPTGRKGQTTVSCRTVWSPREHKKSHIPPHDDTMITLNHTRMIPFTPCSHGM